MPDHVYCGDEVKRYDKKKIFHIGAQANLIRHGLSELLKQRCVLHTCIAGLMHKQLKYSHIVEFKYSAVVFRHLARDCS